jgi:hypothetical protein
MDLMAEERRRRRRYRKPVPEVLTEDCSDAIRHGPTDGQGRCPFCHKKIESAMPKPRHFPESELSEAYDQYYNPDWG